MKTCHAFFLGVVLLSLAACAPVPGQNPALTPSAVTPQVPGRHAMNYMVLTRGGPAAGQDQYYFSGLDAARISISFLSQTQSRISIRARCDGRAFARPATHIVTNPAWVTPGQNVLISVGPSERNQTLLELDRAVTRCDLTVTPGGFAPYVVHMQREELALPSVARLDSRIEGCTGEGRGTDALTRAFLTGGGLSMTCAGPVGPTRFLPDGVDALNAKIEALTGSAVSREALMQGDPEMALDWSHAPQLDLIYINYLNLNADFTGYLLARMLAWHASRGAIVRILVSDVMLTDTDRTLFEDLSALYPTVQVQPYRFPAEAAQGFEGQLGRLHRVTHVKLFATLARQPGRSRVMIGGRNIHEGFFFDAPHDLSDFPFLTQYDVDDERLVGGFFAYDDIEIELRSDAATRAVIGHMGALWHRDYDTQRPRLAAPIYPGPEAREGSFRHFISVPFADGEALLPYYVGLIDAAQHSIRVAVPYLNLPDALDAALRRAVARGVHVDVVTTVHVREVTDFMVTGLNRRFANLLGALVNFYDYDPYPRLLHAKIIVIDGRLTVIASSNLNQRSFANDQENGLVFLDQRISREAEALIQSYIDRGTRVLPGQHVPWLVRWLTRSRVISRAF